MEEKNDLNCVGNFVKLQHARIWDLLVCNFTKTYKTKVFREFIRKKDTRRKPFWCSTWSPGHKNALTCQSDRFAHSDSADNVCCEDST